MGHIQDGLRFQAIESRLDALEGKVEEMNPTMAENYKQPEHDGEWKAVAIEAVIQEHKWADQAIALKHRVQKLNRNRIEEEKDLNRRLALQIEERDRYMEQRNRYKAAFEELVGKVKRLRARADNPECSPGIQRLVYKVYDSLDDLDKWARGDDEAVQQRDRYKAAFEELVAKYRRLHGTTHDLDALEKRARGEA